MANTNYGKVVSGRALKSPTKVRPSWVGIVVKILAFLGGIIAIVAVSLGVYIYTHLIHPTYIGSEKYHEVLFNVPTNSSSDGITIGPITPIAGVLFGYYCSDASGKAVGRITRIKGATSAFTVPPKPGANHVVLICSDANKVGGSRMIYF